MLDQMLKSPVRWLLLLALVSGASAARPKTTTTSTTKGGPPTGPKPEIVGFWRFEHDVKGEARGNAFGAAKRVDGDVYFFNDEVPGPFIYDPLQRLSYPNSASLSFQSGEKHSDALEVAVSNAKVNLAGQSVTLELFCKPNAEWNGPLAMKSRLNDGAAEWGLESRHFEQQNQTYLHGFFTPSGEGAVHFRGGHYGSSVQVRNEDSDWRHVAFVYDAEAKTATCYVDYYQVKTMPVPGELKWDTGSIFIGGGPGRSAFGGLIDEVRLTKGALRPAQFLRARKEPLAGTSFEGVETLLPRDAGYVDLKECFGAMGDGKSDDTAAFREAFRVLSNQPVLDHNTLYIPPGTYLVTDMLQSGRSLTVFGAGAEKTILKLRDKSVGFAKPADAHGVWTVDSTLAPEVAGDLGATNGSGIIISHLTIDTGKNNPGAKGLVIQSGLLQQLEDVSIRADDGAGVAGLELAPKKGGAGFIKNVRIKGFDHGILSTGPESTMALEQIALEGQRLGGIKNVDGILAIRTLTSTNKVPALVSTGAGSMITLLDSALKGGMKDGAAIQSEGALCVLRVETAGYKSAIHKRELLDDNKMEWKETVIAGPKVDEYIGDHIVSGQGEPKIALKLPVENTPEVAWGDIHKDWVNVLKFTDKKLDEDWAPAIQAAIDSEAKTVYFPPGIYPVNTPVHLRGKIERLFGLHSRIAHSGSLTADDAAIIFDEPGAKRVVAIENLEIDGLRHESPATLILKSTCPGHYDNGQGCGKLFMEDVEGADFMFSQPQSVWARQWNGEKHGIFSHGASLWCLGMSAGGEGGVLSTEAGASTEIFGVYVRPVGNMAESRPLFGNTNSRLSVSYGTNVGDAPHDLQIIDTQGEDAKRVTSSSLKWIGGRGRMDLYRSDAKAPPAGN